MFPSRCLRFGPERSRVPDVLAELLEIQDVQVRGSVDQIHQGLRELGVFVQVLELQWDPGHLVFFRVLRVRRFFVAVVVRLVFLVDGHHLDEVSDRVLPVHGGATATLKAPLTRSTIYH